MKVHDRNEEAARVLAELFKGDGDNDPLPSQGDEYGDKWYADWVVPELCKISDDRTAIARVLVQMRDEGCDLERAIRIHLVSHPGCPMATLPLKRMFALHGNGRDEVSKVHGLRRGV